VLTVNKKITQSIKSTKRGKDYRLSYDKWSFVQIMAGFFNLQPFLVAEILLKMKLLYKNRITKKRYENMAIALLLYETKHSGLPCYEGLDVTSFIVLLYRPEDVHRHTVNIYSCLQTIESVFDD